MVISILSDRFLAEVENMPQKNLAANESAVEVMGDKQFGLYRPRTDEADSQERHY